MIYLLHFLKDPKLWELWLCSLLWVMQDFDHQPYNQLCEQVGTGGIFLPAAGSVLFIQKPLLRRGTANILNCQRWGAFFM